MIRGDSRYWSHLDDDVRVDIDSLLVGSKLCDSKRVYCLNLHDDGVRDDLDSLIVG